MHANSFISDKLSRLYDVVVMIFKSKELNLLRCLAKNQGWHLRIMKNFKTYSIEVLDNDHLDVFLKSSSESITACAIDLLERIRTYSRNSRDWVPSCMKALFENVPEFETFEELELNLVLIGSYSANLDYEIRPKRFKRSKRIFIIEC